MKFRPSKPLKNFVAPLTWLTGAMVMMVAMVPGWPTVFEYDAAAIAHGEVWRILTGHLAHWSSSHLFWDLSVFLVLGTLCERRDGRKWIACVVGTAAAVSLYMLILLPDIPVYRGLSGIDTGLFTLLCVGIYEDARKSRDRWLQGAIAGLAAALLAKLVFEVVTGTTIFVDRNAIAFIPIVGAHIIGAIAGIAAGMSHLPLWVCSHKGCGKEDGYGVPSAEYAGTPSPLSPATLE